MTPNELASAVDRYRLSDDAAAGVASDPDDALGALAASYEEQLQRRGAIDFPAMLSWPLRLLRAGRPGTSRSAVGFPLGARR